MRFDAVNNWGKGGRSFVNNFQSELLIYTSDCQSKSSEENYNRVPGAYLYTYVLTTLKTIK